MDGFNFSQVNSAESKAFLKPGNYELSAQEAAYEAPEGKTPFLQITFGNGEGSMREKFYITPKTTPRLQYLHESWFGSRLDKPFQTAEEIGQYFVKAFNSDKGKAISRKVQVQGEQAPDGRVYAKFNYSGFVLEGEPKLGAFEEGSSDWKMNVKIQTNASSGTNSPNLGPDAPPSAPQVDDLPF